MDVIHWILDKWWGMAYVSRMAIQSLDGAYKSRRRRATRVEFRMQKNSEKVLSNFTLFWCSPVLRKGSSV